MSYIKNFYFDLICREEYSTSEPYSYEEEMRRAQKLLEDYYDEEAEKSGKAGTLSFMPFYGERQDG